jgi:hypothetical protein
MATAAFLVLGPRPAAAQEPPLVGFYALSHDFAWAGDEVVVDIAVELTNLGSQAALGVAVTINPPAAFLSQFPNGDEPFGRLAPVDLQPGDKARVSAKVVVPAQEWIRWQDKDSGPNFRVSYHEDVVGEVAGPLRLALTGDIPQVP